jgi:hypothetical protein
MTNIKNISKVWRFFKDFCADIIKLLGSLFLILSLCQIFDVTMKKWVGDILNTLVLLPLLTLVFLAYVSHWLYCDKLKKLEKEELMQTKELERLKDALQSLENRYNLIRRR